MIDNLRADVDAKLEDEESWLDQGKLSHFNAESIDYFGNDASRVAVDKQGPKISDESIKL